MSKTNFGFIEHKYGTFLKSEGENGIRALKCIRSESFKAQWLIIGPLEAKTGFSIFASGSFGTLKKHVNLWLQLPNCK